MGPRLRRNGMKMSEFLVIGGGIAGLAAALALQRIGRKVTVF